jgi:hypothetical protein
VCRLLLSHIEARAESYSLAMLITQDVVEPVRPSNCRASNQGACVGKSIARLVIRLFLIECDTLLRSKMP